MLYPYSNKHSESNNYIVQTGDTLYAISRFYNTSLDDLIAANPDIEPDNILPGQLIFIPLAAPTANCPIGATAYTIEKGDTFYSIARKFKIHLSPLLKSNPGINPDALLIGQKICIPMINSNYINEIYKIRFIYPYLWSKINNERYAGIDGFFQIAVIPGNESLEEVCSNEAHNKHKPYGTQPTISMTLTAGRKSCMIIPSEDQLMEMRGQSALIVKYDVPIEIQGASYGYLLIWTDKKHIKDIAETLEFLDEI